MFLYICCIEVVSTLIGRLINYIKNTETSSGFTMAGRKPAMVAMRSGLQRTPGSQILSNGVFTHLIDAASSPLYTGPFLRIWPRVCISEKKT